jgi:hypothetical protein
VTYQPAISFSISLQHPFNRAGGRTSNVLQNKTDMTKPQKVVDEFEDSRMLGTLFCLILAVWCIVTPAPLLPTLLSVILGATMAGAAICLMLLHRYGETLWVIRSKVLVVLLLGSIFYYMDYKVYEVGIFSMALYAGFWVTIYAMSFAVHERITFIRIGADMENPDIQDIFRKDRRTSRHMTTPDPP